MCDNVLSCNVQIMRSMTIYSGDHQCLYWDAIYLVQVLNYLSNVNIYIASNMLGSCILTVMNLRGVQLPLHTLMP